MGPPGTVTGVSSTTRSGVSSALLLGGVAVGAVVVGAMVLVAAWLVLGPGGPDATVSVGASAPPPESEPDEGWRPWDRNEDGRPVRWDPCSPIELVVSPEGAYPGFRADLEEAAAEVGELAGLEVRVAAEVDERPHGARPLYQPDRYGSRWAPVLVAFAEPHENELPLLDVDHAVAAPVAVGRAGDRTYVSGQVVLNAELAQERARDEGWPVTLRHELGHLLGLAHVDDEASLMYPHPQPDATSWSDGDRRGLQALGAGGCRDVPDAQPLEVELGPAR